VRPRARSAASCNEPGRQSSRLATSSPFPELTERETEAVGLLAAGRDNAGVARRLGVQDGA
jgi:DNA-binding NarL/FixJ family response regulator